MADPLGHGELMLLTVDATYLEEHPLGRPAADQLRVLTANLKAGFGDTAGVVAATLAWVRAVTLVNQQRWKVPGDATMAQPDGTGGPSSALMLTLVNLNALTGGDLTGGLRVAGTGALAANGAVVEVGGVPAKVAAAKHGEADVVFVPAANAAEVTGPALQEPGNTLKWAPNAHRAGERWAADDPGFAVVAVRSDRDVFSWLCGATGGDVPCALATAASRSAH